MSLTLIKVPLEYLYEKLPFELVNNVLQQVKGINNLLVDLEGTSRISASPGCLSFVDHELFMFLKETVSRFSGYVNEKYTAFRQVDEPVFVTACLDREEMAAILRNLSMTLIDSIDRSGEILLSTSCNTQNWELKLESEDNRLLKERF